MPARKDINKILLIGSGPIVIGQACEFDYSGAQGCKALKEEGYTVILVNSNPATIMTDPELSDRTYIEPITPEVVAKIIEKERPDALLPTLGGQTALNTAVQLAENRVLDEYGVRMIGVTEDVIRKAEDRKLFKAAMERAGLEVPRSDYAHTIEEARNICEKIGLPCVIRPSFTLGGSGGGIAYNKDEFETFVSHGLSLSMIGEVLIEESIYGWKEYELEVMRDRKNNVVIVCSIENFDPMGIHTGDSITVAPAQTLTDKEYELLRDASIRIMREIGVETGGSNIQFAINPQNGRMAVIEMNPRVSRSSALASKATGFPIAKFAAKLAVGYTLDEIPNDITKKTPACFEPAIDYCVVKTPRWAFEKFKDADPSLGVQMKSVGETMSIGRTFKEALQKSIRSLEISRMGFGLDRKDMAFHNSMPSVDEIRKKLISPNAERLFYIRYAMKAGMDIKAVNELTGIDPWFLHNLKQIIDLEDELGRYKSMEEVPDAKLRAAKRYGFSDPQLATLWNTTPDKVRSRRKQKGITPVYKLVDTCSAEFEAYTPYYYSTYEMEDESKVSRKKKIMILGGGPNRIGQGIEFDYCCVHASFALRELGYETIMVNSNPETVSTDYDTSDLLFFEPLTEEDILNICDRLNPDGVIVQFGGQTPLNLAKSLQKNGIHIIGTSPESIDRAEDRHKFNELIKKTGLNQPPGAIVYELDKAVDFAKDLGYPVLVRPSYVLGGRAMEIVYDDRTLMEFLKDAADVSPGHPILIDKFLEDAIEVDVDALSDGETVVIAGIMEHIEEAGVHSGDASMTLPPYTLSDQQIAEIRRAAHILAQELNVCGLMNVQFAVKGEIVYVLEVNPRASRTVPFVSKATGVPIAKIAAKLMVGNKLTDLGFTSEIVPEHFSVKESVFPFKKFTGVDIILGPEMRSTGEVMGIDKDLGQAFYKATLAASHELPLSGNVFISVKDSDKRDVIFIAKRLEDLGFKIYATSGTGRVLERNGITVNYLKKISEGRPNPLDMIINGELSLIINTPIGKGSRTDEGKIRASAVTRGITVITTIPGAQAAVNGIGARRKRALEVQPLQYYYAMMKSARKLSHTVPTC